MRRASAVAALALLCVLAGARAEAYVRSKTADMKYGFYWKESCVPVTIYLNRFPATSGMSEEQVVKSVTAAAHAWSADAVSCADGSSPYLEIVPSLAPESAAPPVVAWDAKNSIIFRTDPDAWGKSGSGAVAALYPFEALAVTTVTARLDGHIVDVDMEVNGVGQKWMNLDPGYFAPFNHGDTEMFFDLQNALTHEFGHFIGLDHTCFIPSTMNPAIGTDGKIRPTDNLGNPVPDCGDGSPSAVAATVMYNITHAGETSKRTLSQDDINAVCDIYPASADHDACALDTAAPGCAVASVRPSRRGHLGVTAGLATCGLALAVATAARRRRRLSDRGRARA